MPPPKDRGPWDPLPAPPPTGWEETTILAAGLAGRDLPRLLEAVRASYPALAARCLDEAGADCGAVEDAVEAAAQAARKQLLADLRDPAVHLRARLEAGLRLGRIGDPRFLPAETVSGAPYVRPTLCPVQAGRYLVGNPRDPEAPRYDPDAYDDEQNGEEADPARILDRPLPHHQRRVPPICARQRIRAPSPMGGARRPRLARRQRPGQLC